MSIAILGAGLLGTCAALELADRGQPVVLFERNDQALAEASLHGEGKLHLGFVYAADRSFRTATAMIAGSRRFVEILGRWIPERDLRALPARPFDYVVHRETMVAVPAVETHFARVARALTRTIRRPSPVGVADWSRPIWRRLAPAELGVRYDPARVAAAYETCEIAVDTWAIAASLRGALAAHPRVELLTGARVLAVEDRPGGGYDVAFEAEARPQRSGPHAAVVNALWANRLVIDHRYGLPPGPPWITRRKLGVSLLCDEVPADVPSVTVMLGPFGDVVAYRSGRVYLSWYPACMIGSSTRLEETDWAAVLATVDRDRVRRETIGALTAICPAIGRLEALAAGRIVVNGGSIFALGETDIEDPASRLHRRDAVGITAHGAYLSVDTGKLTLAPWLAVAAADRVGARAGRGGVARR